MPAKRKRGSSKKHSKAMEAQLEQHRNEINSEADGQDAQKTDTPTAETGRTDTDVTTDGTVADEATATDTVDAVETAQGTDGQQPDETVDEAADGKTDAEPGADEATDGTEAEEATENVDDEKADGDGPQSASDGDLPGEKEQDETEAEDGGIDTDTAESDDAGSDGNDTHVEDADAIALDSDTEDSPVEADADDADAEDGDEPADGDSPDSDETDADVDTPADAHEDDAAETPDAETDGAEDGQHATEPSDVNTPDVPSQPAVDATDSGDDAAADGEAETVTEENDTADANTAEQEPAEGTTDATSDDTETDRADGAEDDSDAPQEQEPEQEQADVDTESDEADDKNDVEDTADGKEVEADTTPDTADTPAGAHFAAGDVTAAFDKSIEQAKAIVDSLTGKRDGAEETEKGASDASGIGVEIKTAEEIAESVIGKHGDEEEFKKTIAKLDEMIDEETAKAIDGHDAENDTEDADGEKEAEEAADGDTATDSDSDGENDLKAAAKSVAGWIKETASSIRESVSAKITETKEAVEKAKAEREQKRQEELERKEAEEKAAKEAAADASLTINETADSDESRNDLTADDASEITESAQAATEDTEAAKPEVEAEDAAGKEPEPQQGTEPDKTAEPEPTAPTPDVETAATDGKEGGTGGDAADEKPDTGQTERPDTQTDGRGEDGGKTQPQIPYAYRQPSRRERRRARKAYGGAYGDVSAFERNAYRPDPDKIYGIDPRAYADMRRPQMPAGVPIDPSRIVIIDAANAPRTLRQGVGLETADGRYVSKKQGSGAAIAILVVAMLISGATAAIVTGLVTGTTSSTKSVIQTVAENINEASKQPVGQAFKNAQASVVSVYSYQATSSYGFGIFGYDPSADENSTSTVMSGIGSGVVINGNGDILTNAHIVNGYSDIMVKVGDREYSAALLGIDEESDLAVIHIEGATDLKSLAFADSSKVGIGDVASTIGAPYGYDKTLSNGIISSIDRNGTYETTDGMPMYISLFQTDANVNAQNAGGALVDSAGNLIGINVQTKGIAGGQGLSTAIPSNYAKKVADQIIANGEASHGRIGVELRTDDTGAVAIYSVSKGSSASTAGMKAGDVIVSVGNSKIKSPSDFMMAIEEQPIGEYASIKVKRDGIEQTLKVKVEAGKVTPKTKVDGGESTKG